MNALSMSFFSMAAVLGIAGVAGSPVVPIVIGLSLIGYMFRLLGEYFRDDDIKIALRYGIWGTLFQSDPVEDMPSWWPRREKKDRRDEIILSNKKLQSDYALRIYDQNNPAQTLANNTLVMSMVTKLLPVSLSFQDDHFFMNYEYRNHKIMYLKGLQDYRLIEHIKIVMRMDTKTLCYYTFSYNRDTFLKRLLNTAGKPVTEKKDAVQFKCMFYGGEYDFNNFWKKNYSIATNPPDVPSEYLVVYGMDASKNKTIELTIKFFQESGLSPILMINTFL
jgi:hypothetical protein